jgi:hypothetical protein
MAIDASLPKVASSWKFIEIARKRIKATPCAFCWQKQPPHRPFAFSLSAAQAAMFRFRCVMNCGESYRSPSAADVKCSPAQHPLSYAFTSPTLA